MKKSEDKLVCLVQTWKCPECNFDNLSFINNKEDLICEQCKEIFEQEFIVV